jgi:RNA polymerase sigma-70 factor (ECF subfamily)
MWPRSDETLVLLDQARGGEPGAEDRLLARHRESLRRMIALRLDPALAGRLDASDVVQDVLIEAHRRLNDYLNEPRMPFHLWLRHIAKDHMIDAHRKHRGARKRSLDREQPLAARASGDASSVELALQLADSERTPASAAVQQELERKLNQAMQDLDEDPREIILMRHHEQLSNQDVALALGLSEPAASMRYLRAIRKLRELMVSTT